MTIKNFSDDFFSNNTLSLLRVQNPARYVGGEWGEVVKKEADLRFCMAFPDLYEIGMSNQAMKILYNKLNELESVYCERVFSPAPDFEELLKDQKNQLFTLETKTPIRNMDVIGFTFGYEMGFGSVFTILNSGGIPLYNRDRSEHDPIIIMGGPATSNPLPYSSFIDCFYIGEAEEDFFGLIRTLASHKKEGSNRSELLELLSNNPHVWIPGKSAIRAIDNNFSSRSASASVLPIPNIKIVQDHGAVEVMRGCPNGCRFCHAGIWYRPMRQKAIGVIEEEVAQFIDKGGYREITLSSLSSGDYENIENLVTILTNTYKDRRISFQLPSLKVSSFTLSIMEQLSQVRKSGLTFAIESPHEFAQFAINKEVHKEQVLSIIHEAKQKGWRKAKFYFMIGLPINLPEGKTEETEIVDYITYLYKKTKFQINVNVGTFVPKPHTAFQWAAQLDEAKSYEKMLYIRRELRQYGIKVNTHNTFVSMLEGVMARGDERAGAIFLEAWQKGSRLDAWEDHFNMDIWKDISIKNKDLFAELLGPRDVKDPLPWDSVESGVKKKYLVNEYLKSQSSSLTPICEDECMHNCGICSPIGEGKIEKNKENTYIEIVDTEIKETTIQDSGSWKILFSFSKLDSMIFTPHLGLVEVFSKAFVRSNLPIHYTEGFNPLPKIEFASPLAIGIKALEEIAQVELTSKIDSSDFINTINQVLPEGVCILDAWLYSIPVGTKKISVSSVLSSYEYLDISGSVVRVPVKDDKTYRLSHTETVLTRSRLVAKGKDSLDEMDYFQLFKSIYS